MRKLFLAVSLILCGCAQTPRLVEGTSLQLGAYIPYEGGLYGVEIASYVNGCVVRTGTNTACEITREHTATNSWFWGVFESRERSKTDCRWQ